MVYTLRNKQGDLVHYLVRLGKDEDDQTYYYFAVINENEEESVLLKFCLNEQDGRSISLLENKTDLVDKDVIRQLSDFGDRLDAERAAGADINDAPVSDLEFVMAAGEDCKEESVPYDPEKIRVEPKNLSLKQVVEMIDDDDLDISPDFQRNSVWDATRKSRLIESILLRIPIPVFYFAMDKEGLMQVVDGQQRLTAISQFVNGEYALQDLEYLQDLNGRYYSPLLKKKDKEGKIHSHEVEGRSLIEDKYVRRIKATQLTANVIDYTTPEFVKYDIFRRINTGGRPLNAQEMRNCLMSRTLRSALNDMVESKEFARATGGSVKTLRMQAQEMALRFLGFRYLFDRDGNMDEYSGQMDRFLDRTAQIFSDMSAAELQRYKMDFAMAMRSAYWLFGKHAFRKVNGNVTKDSYRNVINKALFISWSVALSRIPEEEVRNTWEKYSMSRLLGKKIDNDGIFSRLLSYGTNGWKNIKVAFDETFDLLDE